MKILKIKIRLDGVTIWHRKNFFKDGKDALEKAIEYLKKALKEHAKGTGGI